MSSVEYAQLARGSPCSRASFGGLRVHGSLPGANGAAAAFGLAAEATARDFSDKSRSAA